MYALDQRFSTVFFSSLNIFLLLTHHAEFQIIIFGRNWLQLNPKHGLSARTFLLPKVCFCNFPTIFFFSRELKQQTFLYLKLPNVKLEISDCWKHEPQETSIDGNKRAVRKAGLKQRPGLFSHSNAPRGEIR